MRKLKIKRQTVRHLEKLQLDQARGGLTEPGSMNCTEKGVTNCVAFGCI